MNGWYRFFAVVIGMSLAVPSLSSLRADERDGPRDGPADRPPADRARRPVTVPPSFVGQIAAYLSDATLTVDIKARGGQTRRMEFRIGEGTKIELLGDISEIAAGMPVSVWVDANDPKSAARIAVGTNAAPAASVRRPNNRQRNPNASTNRASDAPAKPPVTPFATRAARQPVPGLTASAVARAIDENIAARIVLEGATTAPRCSDAEFIRRVSLDIAGVIPLAARVADFLASDAPDKRAQLVDELLDGSMYGQHFGELWCDRIVPRDLPVEQVSFQRWLAEQLNGNQRWDELVIELLTADGMFTPVRLRAPGAVNDPPALFLLANCEENVPRPDRLAGASAALFLGVQIQCAECHDHPFAPWKQTDFWGLAAFFGQVKVDRAKMPNEWFETPPEVGKPVEIVIPSTALRAVGTTVAARLLDGRGFQVGDDQRLRQTLARWMTSPDNPYFAKATANRLWAHFFGRGLVHPVDDQSDANPPSHPVILALLADELKRSEFDLKHLIRCLCLSEAYQRVSQPVSDGESDVELYAHRAVKVMPPTTLYDSLTAATGFRELSLGLPRSKSKQGVTTATSPRAAFVDFFQSHAEQTDATEYKHGIPQALKLLNAAQLNQLPPMMTRLAQSGLPQDQAVEQLYLTALARPPTVDELRIVEDYLARRQSADRALRLSGVLWALLNSSEFVLNH